MKIANGFMILAIGMRIRSDVATRFRQWAIRHLHEFAVKGFTLDDNRLKGNRSRYFRELTEHGGETPGGDTSSAEK